MRQPASQLLDLSGPGEETDPFRAPQRRLPHRGASSRILAAWERAVVANTAAVLVVSGLFIWMVFRSMDGTNTAGLQMPAMDLQHRVSYWWPFLMGETLGIAALVWSYLSVLVGLLFSTRRPRWLGLNRRQINDLHRHLSLTTIMLIFGHALFVAVGGMNDAMTARAVGFTQAFLPFQTSWNEWPYAFGIFSLYLALILGPTYYLRSRLGARAWAVAHRLSLAVYVLAVAHTICFDDFDFHGPYRLALWVAQIPLAAMLLWRLGLPGLPRWSSRKEAARAWKRANRASGRQGWCGYPACDRHSGSGGPDRDGHHRGHRPHRRNGIPLPPSRSHDVVPDAQSQQHADRARHDHARHEHGWLTISFSPNAGA